MAPMPVDVYSAAQVRDLDRLAIDGLGIPGYVLMCRAGDAALSELRAAWPDAHRVVIVCGSGNNGGDGYVVARLARAAGFAVTVAALESPDRLKGDAARASRDFLAAGGTTVPFSAGLLADADVVVDALFGTGLDREVGGAARACIDAVNASRRPVLAIDIPSGLHADSGAVLGSAMRASRTITFVGLKVGLFVGEGPDHVGRLSFDGLAIPPQAAKGLAPVARRIDSRLVAATLPSRRRGAHKGEHGRVLIVGGGPGMPGAVRLAAEAALRSGAGLVSVATRPEHVSAIVAARPEIICHGIETGEQIHRLLTVADVVAVGPGLGQTPWARSLLEAVLASERPAVLDADALNLLAQSALRSDHWIITPHPGEAARLLGLSISEVQRDRLGTLRALNERYGGVAVLKGAGSLVGRAGATPWLCDRGNPGMATAGMGDVLTGIVAAIAAQCGDLERAAAAGVFVHATAGDLAAARGERGLLAGDLFEHLRACVNPPSS